VAVDVNAARGSGTYVRGDAVFVWYPQPGGTALLYGPPWALAVGDTVVRPAVQDVPSVAEPAYYRVVARVVVPGGTAFLAAYTTAAGP